MSESATNESESETNMTDTTKPVPWGEWPLERWKRPGLLDEPNGPGDIRGVLLGLIDISVDEDDESEAAREERVAGVAAQVKEIAAAFPLYAEGSRALF